MLGIDRAGAVAILTKYHNVNYCTKLNEIYQALTIKLAVDGSRILNYGTYSYHALINGQDVGLDLVARIEVCQRYKKINYQQASWKLEQQRKVKPRDRNLEQLIAATRKSISLADTAAKVW